MFAVTVSFRIKAGEMERFLPLMLDNAATSRSSEPGCHRFDVATDPDRPDAVFLYELYDDARAFAAHLDTSHFKSFDAATAPMIAAKDVRTFREVVQ